MCDKPIKQKLIETLKKPIAPNLLYMTTDHFDPWEDLFPSIYGSYSKDFDDMAIEVLAGLLKDKRQRIDLASEMFREMLCTIDICNYGSSPSACFINHELEEHVKELLEKWKQYSKMVWDY